MSQKTKVSEQPALWNRLPIMHCPGCHYGIIMRALCEVISELGIEERAIGLAGVGCSYGWPRFLKLDQMPCPHGRAPAVATGIKRVHPQAIVFTVQGDGDLGAIGLGCFMNALLRGEKLTTIMLNNAIYGMTGGQMAPTTLLGMRTSTTREGRDQEATGYPLHMAELVATMKGAAYSARVSVHTPANFRRLKRALRAAFEKQIVGTGYGFVEVLSACPASWGMNPEQSLRFIEEEMVAEYPLAEFKNVEEIH